MTKHEKAEQICNKLKISFLPQYKSSGSTLTAAFLEAIFREKFSREPKSDTKHRIAEELFQELGLSFDEAKYTSTGSTLVYEFWEDLYKAL